MPRVKPHRIDPPSGIPRKATRPTSADAGGPRDGRPNRLDSVLDPPIGDRHRPRRASHAATVPVSTEQQLTGQDYELTDAESWLTLHAADLITRLQQWANDLDERETKLNLRRARQEQRERAFRIQTAAKDPARTHGQPKAAKRLSAVSGERLAAD